MLVLASTSDLLQVDVEEPTVGAATLQATAAWRDIAASTYTPGRTLAAPSSNTVTTLVSSPAASTYRLVDQLTVHNPTAGPIKVRVVLYDGTNTYALWRGAIHPGGTLMYDEQKGFSLRESNMIEMREGITDLSSLRQDTVHMVYLSKPVEFDLYGDYASLKELTYLLPDNCLIAYWGAFNVDAEETTSGYLIQHFLQPSSAPFVGTGNEGFVAAGAHAALSSTTELIAYSTAVTAQPTTSPSNAREGGNFIQFHGCLAIPQKGPLTEKDELRFMLTSGYTNATTNDVLILPGSVIFFVIHQYQ